MVLNSGYKTTNSKRYARGFFKMPQLVMLQYIKRNLHGCCHYNKARLIGIMANKISVGHLPIASL
jgi:hypothetical protein